MRIGLIAEVHEAVELLRLALGRLRAAGADRIVFLGDVFETGSRLDETVAELAAARIEGVWGNHDFGLCQDPGSPFFEHYARSTLEYMRLLRPSLVIGDCHFSHVQPALNLHDPVDLWFFQEPPETWTEAELAPSFEAVPQRLLFVGHFHQWIIRTPRGLAAWDVRQAFRFDPAGRYFVVVHAVCEGWCGLLDTGDDTLTAIALIEQGRLERAAP